MRPIIILFLVFIHANLWAAEGKKAKGEIFKGHIESIDGDKIKILLNSKSYDFTMNASTEIKYVSFLGAKEVLKPGYPIRAGEDSNVVWVTLPIPDGELKPGAEMPTMSPEALYKKADLNSDGELSYVEYATVIYRSLKHGPVGFVKSDKDKSGTLSLKEFEKKLEEIKWWRITRKTPAQWLEMADSDSSGTLSKKEFVTVLGSTAHLDIFFKRTDKDSSGDINVEEVAGYIDAVIH